MLLLDGGLVGGTHDDKARLRPTNHRRISGSCDRQNGKTVRVVGHVVILLDCWTVNIRLDVHACIKQSINIDICKTFSRRFCLP